MTELDFTFFDCDNHYYEALDSFTRHIEPQYAKRTMQWANVNGKQRLLVGGAINHFIPNPHFDPVSKPGALDEYFRGRNPKGQDTRELFGQLDPISPAYRNRDARIELMNKQGMGGAIFLPTLGVGMEQALINDVPAMLAAFRSFNRWMNEDWGFAYQDRIFAAPYITLVDVDNAVSELQYALDNDARFIVMVPGPVMTPAGGRSPAEEVFDPFWQLVNDSGITVLYHGGDSRYSNYLVDWGEGAHTEAFRANAFRGLASPNPTQDTLANLLAHGLFHRFPNIRIACIETGSDWVFHLYEKLKKSYGQVPHLYPEDPRQTFKRHVWVSPFYEDDLSGLKELVGVERDAHGLGLPPRGGSGRPSQLHQGPEELRLQ